MRLPKGRFQNQTQFPAAIGPAEQHQAQNSKPNPIPRCAKSKIQNQTQFPARQRSGKLRAKIKTKPNSLCACDGTRRDPALRQSVQAKTLKIFPLNTLIWGEAQAI
jgi:hypothetical protein